MGDGLSTKVWNDPRMILGNPIYKPIPKENNICPSNSLLVGDLIPDNPKRWNENLLKSLFNE